MSEHRRTDGPVSAHNLPMAVSVPQPAPNLVRNRPGAAFLAQILVNRVVGSAPSQRGDSRAIQASSAYRATEISDLKRMPLGYRKAMSA